MLDPTIRLGDILTLIVLAVGGIAFLLSLRGDMRSLSRNVEAHGNKIEKLEAVVVAQAVQTQRINDLDRRIEELRHWQGFINPDGEYDRQGKVKGI